MGKRSASKRRFTLYEAEALQGLKEIVLAELQERFGDELLLYESGSPEAVVFAYAGDPRRLSALKTAVAVFEILHFPAAGPRELLSQEHLSRLAARMRRIAADVPAEHSFSSFRISAAGRSSAVFQRLAAAIAGGSGLTYEPEEGDMLLRIRPSAAGKGGWEVLVRLSPRPLSARAWRVCDMPGALNATIAAAVCRALAPGKKDVFFNPLCGSGTLLIECAQQFGPRLMLGGDLHESALGCARKNVRQAGLEQRIRLLRLDAGMIPLAENAADVVCADLPWGERIGARQSNPLLYGGVLRELRRVARPGARMILITQDEAALANALGQAGGGWRAEWRSKVFQGGFHPWVLAYRRE